MLRIANEFALLYGLPSQAVAHNIESQHQTTEREREREREGAK